jgi:hypothetical protein
VDKSADMKPCESLIDLDEEEIEEPDRGEEEYLRELWRVKSER